MIEKYYVGIDGGGTNTKMVVANDLGEIVFRCEGEGINYYGIGLDLAKSHLAKLFDATKDAGFSDFDTVSIGLSALNEKEDNETTKKLTDFIPADFVDIDSDIGIILRTMEEYPSAVLVSGTGSICSMITSKGEIVAVGGMGHLVGDEGSSYFIGERGIRLALRTLDGWGNGVTTLLVDEMYSYFGTSSKKEIVDKIYNSESDKRLIAGFSLNVESCALWNDAVALEILEESSELLFQQVNGLIKIAKEIPKTLLISGSVICNCKIIKNKFCELMQATYPEVSIFQSSIAPEERALKLALSRKRRKIYA